MCTATCRSCDSSPHTHPHNCCCCCCCCYCCFPGSLGLRWMWVGSGMAKMARPVRRWNHWCHRSRCLCCQTLKQGCPGSQSHGPRRGLRPVLHGRRAAPATGRVQQEPGGGCMSPSFDCHCNGVSTPIRNARPTMVNCLPPHPQPQPQPQPQTYSLTLTATPIHPQPQSQVHAHPP